MEPQFPKMPPPPTKAAKQFALRFISGKYQGGEFPLPRNKEIVVGRSSELDMVLVEDMVSRRHAKITVSPTEIFIEDLGSTNGTFVNGEKIKRTRLNEGDRVLIGTSIIKLVAVEATSAPDPAKANLEEVAQGRRTSQVRTMSGAIDEVPLPDLLQLFGTSKKSGVLVVRTEADIGRLYLDKGRLVYASVNDNLEVAPMKSVIRILQWEHGTFDMDPPEERQFPQTMDMSTEGILMEAFRQLDEIKRVSADIPDLHAAISLAMPLIPALKDLSPAELDVVQLVFNYGHIEAVLNKAQASDLDTMTVIAKLLKSGYFRRE
jgi:pSer/pThr/pTyr-binding forkhead associated (FHA) protein